MGGAYKTANKPQKSGSIQAPLSSELKSRRAGEQSSPLGARVAGHPDLRDEGGGSDSGSSSVRRFT